MQRKERDSISKKKFKDGRKKGQKTTRQQLDVKFQLVSWGTDQWILRHIRTNMDCVSRVCFVYIRQRVLGIVHFEKPLCFLDWSRIVESLVSNIINLADSSLVQFEAPCEKYLSDFSDQPSGFNDNLGLLSGVVLWF